MKTFNVFFIALITLTTIANAQTPVSYYETEVNNLVNDAGTQTVIHSNALLHGESNQEFDVWLLDNIIFTTELYVKKINGNAAVKLYKSDHSDYSNATIDMTISSAYSSISLDPSKYYYIRISSGNANGHIVQIANVDFVPVPVELMDFNAKVSNNDVMLTWTTATEENSSHFEIEKSTNGTNWTNISEVESHHNSSTVQNYSYEDINIETSSNIVYYRLKMVDLDDTYEYSDVVSITLNEKKTNAFQMNIFPNPTTDYIIVEATLSTNLTHYIRINNVQGQTVLSKTIEDSKIQLDISSLPKGYYYVNISNENSSETRQIIKIEH